MAKYTAIFSEAEDGSWTGYVPDLATVVAMGDTLAEAQESMKEALDIWMIEMKHAGLAIPVPSHRPVTPTKPTSCHSSPCGRVSVKPFLCRPQ